MNPIRAARRSEVTVDVQTGRGPGRAPFIDESAPLRSSTPLNGMSVDVEEHFQVGAFESSLSRKDWASQQSRVLGNMERILALFDENDTRATFFTLGWVAERMPQLVRAIVDADHDISNSVGVHIPDCGKGTAEFVVVVQRGGESSG